MSALAAPAYRSRPIRTRRTKADIASLRETLRQVLADDHPMTVRQCFYRLVSLGAIAKTEMEYKATVVRLLTEMRRDGTIPYGWIADNTRWMRKPRTYRSLTDALRYTAETYRRMLWQNQPAYIEVWLEKDALAGVLYEVTEEYDVPLMVTRGYPSVSYLHEAAAAIAACGKPAYLYYLGDHDPSGLDIPRAVEKGLREMAPRAEIHFQQVAVTPRQIDVLQLPTRPTKTTDSRAKSFTGESVEVDAIPPGRLRGLVRWLIEQHLDPAALEELQVAEESERGVLGRILDAVGERA